MLRLEGLEVGYAGRAVLDPISVDLAPGTFCCLLGRNGAGKSTLLRTLAGLHGAIGGSAALSGEAIGELDSGARARRIAVVLTKRAGSPGLTVDDVLALGRAPYTRWTGRLSPDDTRIIDAAVSACGIRPFLGRAFDSLSDGERQRVLIARAMAQSPRLMLLDEITAFLDLPGRVEMMEMLRRHARTTGCIVLLSSHDLDLSLQLADGLWVLPGAGRFAHGSASALVTAGVIGDAFNTAAVRFDAGAGRFVLATSD